MWIAFASVKALCEKRAKGEHAESVYQKTDISVSLSTDIASFSCQTIHGTTARSIKAYFVILMSSLQKLSHFHQNNLLLCFFFMPLYNIYIPIKKNIKAINLISVLL